MWHRLDAFLEAGRAAGVGHEQGRVIRLTTGSSPQRAMWTHCFLCFPDGATQQNGESSEEPQEEQGKISVEEVCERKWATHPGTCRGWQGNLARMGGAHLGQLVAVST